MSVPRTTAWGVGLALAAALISGVSIYLNGRIVGLFDDPTLLAAVRNGLVGIVFALAIGAGGLAEVRRLDRRQGASLVAIGVIGGGLSFALFFNGLALSTSPAAALIHKTLFLWVALLAVLVLRERLGFAQVAALAVLFAGTLTLAPAGSLGAGVGEAMIVAATGCWAVEVVLVRRLLLGTVSPGLAAASRMLIGSTVLFVIVAATGSLGGIAAFGVRQWAAIAVTGALLTGYVATWYGALQRAPASLVTSVLVVGAVVTTALQALTVGAAPSVTAMAGNAVLLIGTAIAVAAVRRGRRPATARVAATS